MFVLYVFLDHAGELRFFPQSNRYFTLASLCTWDPRDFAAAYHALKHELVTLDTNGDWDHHRFHASEEKAWIRNAFFDLIGSRTDIRADALTVRKNRIFKAYQPPHIFYPHMTNLLLKFVLPKVMQEQTPDRIEFIVDQFPLKDNREAFLKKMESLLHKLSGETPYRMRFHYSHAHPHLQAVDYIAWAVYRHYEARDREPRTKIKNVLKSDWEYASRVTHQVY